MNRFLVSFVLVFILPVLAYAQDAGMPEGADMPSERVTSLATCMARCTELHAMCVSTNDIQQCLHEVPECQSLAASNGTIITAFCEACGNAAAGCSAPDAGVPDAGPPVGTGSVLAYESSPEDEPAETEDTTPPAETHVEPEHRHRTHPDRPPLPPPVRTVEDLCRVAGGIWDPDYVVTQSIPPTASTPVTDSDAPHPGDEVRGVCWTREGEVLARRLRAESTARVEGDAAEARDRAAADHAIRHDMEETDRDLLGAIRDRNRDLNALLIRIVCHEHGEGNLPISTFEASRRDTIREAAVSNGYHVEGDNIRCPAHRADASGTATASSASASSRSHDTFGFRASLMPGLGFQPLTAEANIESSIPFYIMGELSLDAWIGGDWYVDGGFAFGYPFPDYHGRAMLEGLYHLGFLALITTPVIPLAVGFGGTLQERYTDVFQSMHTIAGGYVEFDVNLGRGGWMPYLGVRVDLGVGLRGGYGPVLDGSAFLMLGIAHLDSNDNNVHLPDCDTEYCRDTPIGRTQLP